MGGDGGTDVGAENYSDCLAEFEDSGVHKPHGYDGGGGGALDEGGQNDAQNYAFPGFARELFEYFREPVARDLFKARAEHMHSV